MPLIPIRPDAIPSTQEPTLGSRVSGTLEGADVAILSCTDDPGHGSDEVRQALYGLSLGLAHELASIQIADLGDVSPGTAAELEAALTLPVRQGVVCVVLCGSSQAIAGGHAGVFAARPGRGASVHVDRGLGVSAGGPFRAVLDRFGSRVASYLALGAQTQHDSKASADYVKSKGARFTTLDELRAPPGVVEKMRRELGAAVGAADFGTVSLSLRAASASGGDGFSVEELARFADQAGRHPKVQLLSIEGAGEPRLAAHWLWKFLLGVVQR